MIDNRKFYIDGEWVAPVIPCDHNVINPSTGKPCGVISLGSEVDTNAAVAAAKKAFVKWSQTHLDDRLSLMQKLLDIYNKNADAMGKLMSLEMGAPIDMSLSDQVSSGSMHLSNIIDTARNFTFERPLNENCKDTHISLEPIGVCGLITPWNWPMNQMVLKVAPALAAGCTMVLKPSEIAPLSSVFFAEMIDKANFPAGVFNLVNGDGIGVGTQLSQHVNIDMISFTGSTRAGKAITKNAADSIKRVSLELGGKGANIIFADADIDAVERGVMRLMHNSGQSCDAPSRMLVQRSIYEKAVETAKTVTESIQLGDALASGDHLGPVVSKVHFDKIQGLIRSGIIEGAKLVIGGEGSPELPEALQGGYFIKPTVFADVSDDMAIAREEIFGPVIAIMPFDTEEEAIAIANDTPYGLTNYIETSDMARAKRMAKRLRSGVVELNGNYAGEGAPFGGFKQSGNGREGGVWGLEDFLEVKTITGWTD